MTKYFLYKKVNSKKLVKLLQLQPTLAKVIDPKKPITIRITPDPYVCLIHSILGFDISSQELDNIWSKLILYVKTITPKAISKATTEQFDAAGVDKIKIKNIRLITKDIIDKKINLKKMKKLSKEKIAEILFKYSGMNWWIIDMLLIFCYEFDDVLSLSDPQIKLGLEKIFDIKNLTTKYFKILKLSCSPYGTFVAYYAWKICNLTN